MTCTGVEGVVVVVGLNESSPLSVLVGEKISIVCDGGGELCFLTTTLLERVELVPLNRITAERYTVYNNLTIRESEKNHDISEVDSMFDGFTIYYFVKMLFIIRME